MQTSCPSISLIIHSILKYKQFLTQLPCVSILILVQYSLSCQTSASSAACCVIETPYSYFYFILHRNFDCVCILFVLTLQCKKIKPEIKVSENNFIVFVIAHAFVIEYIRTEFMAQQSPSFDYH